VLREQTGRTWGGGDVLGGVKTLSIR